MCFIGTGLAILKLLSGYAETEQISHLELDFSLEKEAAKTEREKVRKNPIVGLELEGSV